MIGVNEIVGRDAPVLHCGNLGDQIGHEPHRVIVLDELAEQQVAHIDYGDHAVDGLVEDLGLLLHPDDKPTAVRGPVRHVPAAFTTASAIRYQ